ncbi:MAG: YeeE/YedE thiosulfate transporter family protein [Halieaceae bacterium]|nr:YeeE/YedE thiosulfate transporter family protein [Halieaceae bacterium]
MSETYLMATAGGLLIGLSSVLLLLGNGRIAGISNILWGAVSVHRPLAWRWLFLAGLLAGGALAHTVFAVPLPEASRLGTPMALLGGLVVGLGTRLGNGCTSGHGVCGLGLLSLRSLLATLCFMASGVITVYVLRHILGIGL